MLPPGENIVETKTCRISGEPFVVTDKDLEFYDQISPVFCGSKKLIPSPSIAPYERFIQKFAWRNERSIVRRTCDLTGKNMVSMYHSDLPYTVYCEQAWHGDSWHWSDYSRAFDFDRPFFDQMHDLMLQVPLLGVSMYQLENSEFNNCAAHLKNCYLCFDVDYLEDCYYLTNSQHCKDCIDCSEMSQSQHCYGCYNCSESRNLIYSVDCVNSHDLLYCRGCVGCSDCILCFNQYQKRFSIMNVTYDEKEYYAKKAELLSLPTSRLEALFHEHSLKHPFRSFHGIQNESSSGDYLDQTQHVTNSFVMRNTQDCKNCFYLSDAKNCQDHLIFGDQSSFVYNCLATGENIRNCSFNAMCWQGCQDVMYSFLVFGSQNCFGCVGIKKAKNTVLNTTYSQLEYEQKCEKIIDHMQSTGEWGEWFPMRLSPYGFNETVGMDYTPLTQEEVLKRGGKWVSRPDMGPSADTYYHPKPIHEYNESMVGSEMAKQNIQTCLSSILLCLESGKAFKIQKRELAYLIENMLPIPQTHPDVRLQKRNALHRPGLRLYTRTCGLCSCNVQTPYDSSRPEIIYCEECYRKEVY